MQSRKRRWDVIVVGGGVAGCADAFFLARQGMDVLLLEKNRELAALTTARAAACFRAQWSEADFARLVLESIRFYEAFAENTGLIGWDIAMRQHGWLFLSAEREAPKRFSGWVAGHRLLGVDDSELLIGQEIRDRFPWVSESVTAATFRARDGWLSPYEVTMGFAKASGAETRLATTVHGITLERGAVKGVRTNDGLLRSDRVVIAAGPFSARLAKTAGVDLALLPIRRQLASIRRIPTEYAGSPMVSDVDRHVYWRPEGAGAFLGLPLTEAPTEPTDHIRADWDFPARALDAASHLTPFWGGVEQQLTGTDVSVLAGQYTCTSDIRPVIGPVPGVMGLFIHSGDNGWGIEAAPASARILAEAVAGRCDDDSPYRADRPLSHGLKRPISDWP